jgi:GWxTD domain-containing protein
MKNYFNATSIRLCLLLIGITFLRFNAVAKISASVDYLIFPAEKGGGRLILLFGVDGNSIRYQKLAGGFHGTVSFSIAVNDSVRNYFAENMDLNSPILKDSSQFDRRYSAMKEIALPSGNFTVDMLIYDPNSQDTLKEKLNFIIKMPDAQIKPVCSDLMLMEPEFYDPAQSVFEQKIQAIRSSDFYMKADTVLRFYSEAHGILRDRPAGIPLVSRVRVLEQSSKKSLDEFGKIRRVKSGLNLAYITDLPIKNLPSGNYLLIWDLIDTAGKIVAVSYRDFRKSNPGLKQDFVDGTTPSGDQVLATEIEKLTSAERQHLVASLLPIASTSEQSTIDYLRKKGTETEVKNYLASFWSKRSGQNASKELRQYHNLVVYADSKYSTQTMKAYQTERGRIILQYGKPNIIENEYSDRQRKAMQNLNTVPYEVWYYYYLEVPVKQSDVMFVFVQQNRGNDNYRLIHSSAIGEVRNGEWRSVVENNATYNFDRLSPNDRNEQANPKTAR